MRIPMQDDDWRFLKRLALVALAVLLLLVAVLLRGVLLLMFASVLIGVGMTALTRQVVRWTPLPRPAALALVVIVCLASLAGFLWLFGVQVVRQLGDIVEMLPTVLEQLSERFGLDIDADASSWEWRTLLGGVDPSGLGKVFGYGSTAAGILADIAIVLVGGIFLSSDPAMYRDGAVRLFPQARRPLLRRTLDDAGEGLQRWLGGQLVVMAGVAIASYIAYASIGLPSALSLALIAGIADFVPFVGPIVGAIPALVMAATQDLQTAAITLAAVVAIQQLESYVLVPLVQKKAVKMPPFVGIFAVLLFGTLFGALGVLLAVPITLVLIIVVQRLWVRATLGDPVPIIGQGEGE